ncbi:MAG: GAF domain-containing protein [Armatimonadetes bacterium]|nr:GAF domain-containing protein [Anaerolineae bacterium]
MDAAFILFIGGVVVVAWVFSWVLMHREAAVNPIPAASALEPMLDGLPLTAAAGDAVLVSKEHGQLVYVNSSARQLLGVNGGEPNLEQMARNAQPADSFLELFAGESQSAFQLGARWVEASSHRIPAVDGEMRTVVILRELSGGNGTNSDLLDLAEAIALINRIGENVNAGLGVEQTLQTLLSLIKQSINFDAGEINLQDEATGAFKPQGWLGDPTYLITLSEAGGEYHYNEGVTGWIARHEQPLFLPTRESTSVKPKVRAIPYQSMMGVPLLLGEKLIGTLELAGGRPNQFAQNDFALLQAIAKPVTVAIYNATLYADQVRRVENIATLQQTIEQETSAADGIFAILTQRVAQLAGTSLAGVFLYDEARQGLTPTLPFFGIPDAVLRGVFIAMPPDSPQRDIWERQTYWISNDVRDEPLVDALGLQTVVNLGNVRNTAWLPLQIGSRRIGVLTVSNKINGTFTPRDIANLRALASQTAIVVENIQLATREQNLDAQIAGLQEITYAIGALTEESEFFSEITQRIATLMDIELCGILLYDETKQRLVSRLPFVGAPDDAVRDYTIDLTPGTAFEEIWSDEPYWYSNRVPADTLTFAANLDGLAAQLNVQKTLIATMSTGGRKVGVVQVANKRNGRDFTDNDARLLLIFATQSAAIMENNRLFLEVRHRSEESQQLRRIAELAGTVTSDDDGLRDLLTEIAAVTGSPLVYVNVLSQTGTLVTYPRWVYGAEMTEPVYQDAYAPGFEHSVVRSRIPFISNDVPNDPRVLGSYRQVSLQFGIRRSLVVPLIIGDRVLGEIGIANRPDVLYTEADLVTLQAVAAQISAALDRILLYQATGDNLNRRVEELDAISRISNELTLTLDFDQILNTIRKEALNATNATGVTVALLKPADQWRNPKTPELERRLGNSRVMVDLAEIELLAITRRTASVVVDDYHTSDLTVSPPEARSGLAAGILYIDQIVGVLHLYHTDPNHFDDQSAAFGLTMASKASLGYGNAIRFQEQNERNDRLRRRVEQLNRIFELGHMLPSSAEPLSVLEAVAYSVQQAVGFDLVLMLMTDDETGTLKRVAHAGLPIEAFEQTKEQTISAGAMNQLFDKYEYIISESYLFPVESAGDWYIPEVQALTTSYDGKRTIDFTGRQGWRDGDILMVPIRGATGALLGVMTLDRPQDNRRPERATVEVLEIFAHQASNTLENARLYQSSVQSAELETRFNEVMESVASTLEINKIIEVVAQGMARMLPLNRMNIALLDNEGKSFEVVRGTMQPNGKLEVTRDRRLSLNRTALGRSFIDRQEHLYRMSDDPRPNFDDLRDWYEQGERIGVVLPLIVGGECLGALHVGSDRPDTRSFLESIPLLRRMAQLVAAAIQNARLYNQAVVLQLLNESVVESIQQGIIVLNPSGRIISINQFMRQRYGWTDQAIGQDLFAYRDELTPLIGQALRYVLENGVPEERLNQMIYDQDQRGPSTVRNFYLYPMRSDGTVRGAVMLVEDVTERAILEEQIEARANQLAALTEVAIRITSSLEREEVVGLSLDEMAVLIKYSTMTHWRRNGSFMVMEGYAGTTDVDPNIETRVRINDFERVRQLVDSQRVVVLNSEQRMSELLPGEAEVRSWMGVPLVNQGHVVGMFVLTQKKPNAYDTKSDQNIAFAFASQVAISLANADLFEQTFDRTNELGTLLEAAQATSNTQNVEQIFSTVTDLMLTALEMDRCTLFIWGEVDNDLEVQLDVNRRMEDAPTRARGQREKIQPGSAKQFALTDREVVVISQADQDMPYPEELLDLKANGASARMLVPLVAQEGSIGLLQLEQYFDDGRVMTQQKVRLARALGAQVAVAIQNARLQAEMSNMFTEALIINDLSRAISSKLNMDDMVAIVRDQIPAVTQSNELYLALYDADTQMISFPLAVRSGQTYSIPPRQLGTDEVSFIIKFGRYLSLGADYFSPDELRRSLNITNGEGDARSYLGVPLKSGDRVFGVLALRDTERTRAFTINDQRILETVGAQLGAAIQNAQLFDRVTNLNENLNQSVEKRTRELEEERDRLDTLYQITSELARTLDMERLQQQAIGMVAKAVGAEDGVIFGLNPLTDELVTQAYLNPNTVFDRDDGEPGKMHPAESLAQWLIQNQQAEPSLVVHDLHDFSHWDMSAPGALTWRSALAVVLESNQNDPQGVMVLLSANVGEFGESELRLLVAAANQVAASINNADLYHLIRDQAERLGSLLRAEQEEAEKNSAILEAIADGVTLSDADGKVILFNTAAERILGLPREQVLGQTLSKFTGLYGAEVTAWAQTIQDRAARAEIDMNDEFVNDRLTLGDKIVSAHLAPVYTGDKLLGIVSVFRDITREVEVDRMKSEFIANVSHEFRTPLTTVKGYNDLIMMGAMGALTEMQVSAMGKVKENVDRLTVLVEDVLDISKIDSGRERLKLESINFDELLDTALESLRSRPSHARKTLALNINVQPGLTVRADRSKLTRIMTNIVDNAFNYTPSGGSIEIRAKLQPEIKRILIEVQDSGVGIPEDFRDEVWKRFQRYEEHALTLDVAGTGLGLSIVKEMVEMHGGEVWFESMVDQGTTFYISFPVDPPDYTVTRTSTGTYRQVRDE